MGERHSSAVQQVAGVGQQTVEDVRLTQSAMWTPSGLITSRSGFVPTGTAAAPGSVLATTPTPNGFVHVQPFRQVMQSSRSGGVYVQCLDAIKDINILSTSADPSNARRDLIIAQQTDTYIGGDTTSDMVVKQVVGTPSGSPMDPTVTGSADYIVLARVTVTAGANSISTGNITQLATQLTVATGGLLPVANVTERNAIANPYPGMQCFRMDKGWSETYYSSAWRVDGLPVVSALADVTNPLTKQVVRLSSDGQMYGYTGTAWAPIGPVRFNQVASGDLTLATADTDIPGATVTFTTVAANAVAKVKADYDFELTAAGTGYCYGSLYVDGARHAKQALFLQGAAARIPGSMTWYIVLTTPGSHTLKLNGHKDINAGTAFHRGAGTLIDVDLYQL